jgi:signal transduction histidine kinase
VAARHTGRPRSGARARPSARCPAAGSHPRAGTWDLAQMSLARLLLLPIPRDGAGAPARRPGLEDPPPGQREGSLMESLQVLQIEDDEDHALLIEHELRRGGFEPECTRVDTVHELREVLTRQPFDLITSDYGLPRFDAPSALSVVREFPLDDVPFIIVSGSIPDTAVSQAMKAGAHDFVSKSDLKRLAPAVRRELKEARSRKARRLAEARFRTLARSLDGLVVTLDRDLVIDGVYGRGLLGAPPPPEALIGASVREFFQGHEQDEIERTCRAVLAGSASGEATLHLGRTLHGVPAYIEVVISPMLEPDGRVVGLLGSIRDVSEQRKLQAQVVASDRLATIGTLAAGVAHEINNPLSALLSNLHVLGRDVARLAGGDTLTPNVLTELAEIIGDANAAAAMVLTIAGDLRTFARQGDEVPGPVSPRKVLESALRMVRNQVEAKARLVRQLDETPPVLAIESGLGQVFLNLLVNAAQAIPDGEHERHEIRVRLHDEPETGHVVVSISDTGQGMTDSVKQRLFSPFFTTKPSGVGTGLGLSICKRLITSFGGAISVTSQVGEGTTFVVRLLAAKGA